MNAKAFCRHAAATRPPAAAMRSASDEKSLPPRGRLRLPEERERRNLRRLWPQAAAAPCVSDETFDVCGRRPPLRRV